MDALMCVGHRDTVTTFESETERIWKGEPDQQANDRHETSEEEERSSIRQRLAQPVSRRELLRGRLKQNQDAEQ